MKELSGLCMSCRNAPTCTFLRDPKTPVLQCDEFHGFESPSRRSKNSPRKRIMDFKSNPGKKGPGSYKGLCSICEGRETCTYPKPEGGVWHCEEYR